MTRIISPAAHFAPINNQKVFVEQPPKIELVINLKAAKQIGLIIFAECAGAGGQVIK